jgi:hypothetical protein
MVCESVLKNLRMSASPRLVIPRVCLVRLAACAFVLTVVTGCRPSEPLMVTAIQTGKSLNSDNSIATHAATFRAQDKTMYVSVLTGARGSGTIVVRWMLGGRAIHEVSKDVSYNDQAATDFRFQAADGFPRGEYIIEVLLDGKPAGTRSLRVE